MRDYTGYGCVLTTWFVGKPAERVMGIKKNFLQPFCDCEDYATFTLDFGDSVGFLEGSWSTGHGGNLATGPIVYGSEGIIVADRYDSWVRVYLDPRLHPDAPSPYLAVETAPLADNIAKNVLDFVQNGTPLFEMITADFNLKAMVAFDAGIRSCENGQVEVCEVP